MKTPAELSESQADAMEAIFALAEAIEKGGLTIQDLTDAVKFAVAGGHGAIIISLQMASIAVSHAETPP